MQEYIDALTWIDHLINLIWLACDIGMVYYLRSIAMSLSKMESNKRAL